ncbi:MAG TPA: hypothetical protein VMU43_10130 [Candidatus Acidoferrum sp.]|nr:hypothetical protein [Candidatus Acidoferrum sp.]
MTTKTPIPIKLSSPAPSSAAGSQDHANVWAEARLAYPLYAGLALQFSFAAPPYPEGQLPPERPTREAFDKDLKWLASIDDVVRAYQIRQLPSEVLNASSDALRAFAHRQLRKSDKTNADRDKIDFLLVQYFALCAPETLYRSEIALADVARVLQPVLSEADPTPLEWCAPLDAILATVDHCQSLRDLLEQGVLEKGRMLKDSAGAMFYDPAALVAFCRFNFLVRRAFIRLLHADLAAVLHAIDTLDAAGFKTADCRRAGFSAAETTAQLRYYAENWRQPFHKDYTENSVNRAFEQLLALRADLEDAVAHALPASMDTSLAASLLEESASRARERDASHGPVPAAPSFPGAESFFADSPASERQSEKSTSRASSAAPSASSAKPLKPAGDSQAAPALDADKCMETIWEQLIAAPPSRGRSMSTVVLRDTKVLLSSWEVAAFVTEGGQEAEDLRRAVVARALLAVAMDERKRSGEMGELTVSMNLARTEVSYFQGRVEAAKRSKNTEAAVNLGISTKRLLSFLEEAEKLEP